MKKILKYILIIMCCIIFAGCKNNINKDILNRENESKNARSIIKNNIDNKNFERYDLLMTKYINDTKIFGISVSGGIYDELLVEIGGNTKEFKWKSLPDDSYLPQIDYLDVNNDDEKEAIIILTEDIADNFKLKKIHVLNIETLEEIEVENPKEYIDNNITYRQEDNKVALLIDEIEVAMFNTDNLSLKADILENFKYDYYYDFDTSGEKINATIKIKAVANEVIDSDDNEEEISEIKEINEINEIKEKTIKLTYSYNEDDNKLVCKVND